MTFLNKIQNIEYLWIVLVVFFVIANGDPDPVLTQPKLSVTGRHLFIQGIECDTGLENTTQVNLSAIKCLTRTECDRGLLCLRNNLTCTNQDKVIRGVPCRFSPHSEKGNEGCSVLDPKSINYGVVECTATTNNNSIVYQTTDYFYKGVNYFVGLLSNWKSGNSNSSTILIKMQKNGFTLNTSNSFWNGILYTNEEIRFSCMTSQFFYNETTLKLQLFSKDGTIIQINPKAISRYSYRGNAFIMLNRFRVPSKNVAGFTCSADPYNNSVPIVGKAQPYLNFTTIDPPLNLTAISSVDGKIFKFDVNQSLGCNYNGTKDDRRDLNRILFTSSWDDDKEDDPKVIGSIITFLRFREFAGSAATCKILDENIVENSTQDFQYLVKIVQNAPSIVKMQGQVINLQGHTHRTLSCKYNGVPEPYVVWYKDQQQILDPLTSTSTNILEKEVENVLEESRFVLPSVNMTSGQIVNYTCVAFNHLGQDSLTFLIAGDSSSNEPFGKSISCSTLSWLFALSILAFIVTLGFSLRRHLFEFLDKFKREDQQQLQLNEQ